MLCSLSPLRSPRLESSPCPSFRPTRFLPPPVSKTSRYAIRDLACIADEVVRQGHKILPLNIGDPLNFDFETPAHMIEAVYKAMRDGKNGYAPSSGIRGNRRYSREAARKGLTTVRDVFVTAGVSETVDLCFSALVNPATTC